MLNAKRLYLYSVLGVRSRCCSWGVTSIFRLALQAIGAAAGSGDAVGADWRVRAQPPGPFCSWPCR